jgi:hypothetical protein
MATRSNLHIIDAAGNALWIYRHWDGYPACNGACIAKHIKRLSKGYARQSGSFAPLINALLAERFDDHAGPRPVYEVTSGEHGDIEWLYEIQCKGSRVTITVTEIDHDDKRKVHGMMSEAEFRSFVAKEIGATIKRARAFRKRNKRAA